MGFQYAGELRYVAKVERTGTILEVPVKSGFRTMYDAVKRELRAEVGGSLFYDTVLCNVFVAYVVERRDNNYCQTQYCFEEKIGCAYASCIDKVTHFEFVRRE